MADSVHLLLNPAAAGGRAARRFARREPALRAALGQRLTVHRSGGPGELTRLAAELAGERVTIVAAGGDGTSSEVIQGLAQAGPNLAARLWWLPLGSGNDLARTLGASDHPDRFLDQILIPHERAIDLGRVMDLAPDGSPRVRWLGNSLALGLPPEVLVATERYGKPLGGRLSYALAAVVTLLRHRPCPLSLRADGEALVGARYRLVALSNGGRFGAGMRIAPEARLDDGRLDLVTVGPISRGAALSVFPRVYRGSHLLHPGVSHQLIRQLRVEGTGELPLELDGESVRISLPFQVEVAAGRLRIAGQGPG